MSTCKCQKRLISHSESRSRAVFEGDFILVYPLEVVARRNAPLSLFSSKDCSCSSIGMSISKPLNDEKHNVYGVEESLLSGDLRLGRSRTTMFDNDQEYEHIVVKNALAGRFILIA